ncbi:MAG: DNA polymerase III subunit [Dehalococcoidia bacterium]
MTTAAPATATVASAPWGVVGQEHAVRALRSAIEADRLAHAYLFIGPHGSGRATLARRLARALDCESPTNDGDGPEPCGECRPCRLIEAGAWPDVERITIGGVCDVREHRDHQADGSTRIRICQVRRLERVASLAPTSSRRRIFIIDTADDLQTEAAHALLKLLEEPPATATLVLLATDVLELLPTVRSRCQEIVLRPLSAAALAAALDQVEAEAGSAPLDPFERDEVARLAHGRFGRALELLRDPSLRMLRETAAAEALEAASSTRNERLDMAQTMSQRWFKERESVIAGLDVWRDVWREALHAAAGLERATTEADSIRCTPAEAARALSAVQTAREHLLDNTNPQLALEVMMLDLPLLPAREQAAGDDRREEDRSSA